MNDDFSPEHDSGNPRGFCLPSRAEAWHKKPYASLSLDFGDIAPFFGGAGSDRKEILNHFHLGIGKKNLFVPSGFAFPRFFLIPLFGCLG